MVSPTALSLKELRKRGYMAAVVEKVNPWVKIRQDLFGIIDVIGVHPVKKEVIGVQATTDTGGQASKHRMKVLQNPNLKGWMDSGCKFEIWAWAKKGKASKRKLWTLREVEV